MMKLDHFILWSHFVWTDPASRHSVRAWNYDPEAWVDEVADASVFEELPPKCKKGGARIRINCDVDGHWHPKQSEGIEHVDALFMLGAQQGPEGLGRQVLNGLPL